MDDRLVRALCERAGLDITGVDLDRLTQRAAALFDAVAEVFTVDTTGVEMSGTDPRWR